MGSAANGNIALQRVQKLKPDLPTLDIEMPEMDGLAVLDAPARKGEPTVEVIVVSAVSRRRGDLARAASSIPEMEIQAARLNEALQQWAN